MTCHPNQDTATLTHSENGIVNIGHILNATEPDVGCTMSALHSDTVRMLKRFPELDWSGQAVYLNATDIYATKTHRDLFLSNIAGSTRYMETVFVAAETIEVIGEKILREDVVLPGSLTHLTQQERQGIVDWNWNIYEYTLSSLEEWIPILPIQALWMIDCLDTNLESYLCRSETAHQEGAPGRILLDESIPKDLIGHFCRHPNAYIRQMASRNPGCLVEDAVIATLLS